MHSGERPAIADIRRQLGRFRRRLIAVAFLEYLMAAGAATLVASDIAVIGVRPAMARATWWLSGAIVSAAAIAAVLAVVRSRSLVVTALTVDRRLHLDDRATTALECAEAFDPMSQLMLADARAHLLAHEPRELRPVWPFGPRTIVVGLTASFAVFALAVGGTPSATDRDVTRRPGAAARAPIGAGQLSSRSSAPDRPRESAPPPGESGGTALEQPQTGRTAGARQADGSLARPVDSKGQRSTNLARRTEASGANGASSPTDTRDKGLTQSSESLAAGTNAADRPAGIASGQNGPGAGRGGGSAIAVAATGAGGVKSAPGAEPAAVVSPKPVNRSDYALLYRNALQAAQSPVAQERIPVRLRNYVRAYFLAIRPDGEPGGQR